MAALSYSADPTLYLYTSLTAGSSHIITATSRLETILKANKIPFRALDCATDEKARMLWGRRSKGRKLPGLVKFGTIVGVSTYASLHSTYLAHTNVSRTSNKLKNGTNTASSRSKSRVSQNSVAQRLLPHLSLPLPHSLRNPRPRARLRPDPLHEPPQRHGTSQSPSPKIKTPQLQTAQRQSQPRHH